MDSAAAAAVVVIVVVVVVVVVVAKRRKARTIDVSYSLGSMEDPRKKPEPDMEIAKAYRSIIMGPQRENLGRGACFLGQRWKNWKLQPFTFQSSGIF